jgi:hypothetical protein
MELSIEVNHSRGASIFICRGKLIRGQESDYLFDLVTRPDSRDVVLDVEQLDGFDRDGLSTIVLCHELLSQTNRRLLLRNASSDMLLNLDSARLQANKGPRSDRTAIKFASAASKR